MAQRIGLLTLPLHTNYGGMLQAAALYHILTVDLGQEVIFLERTGAVRTWSKSMIVIRTLSRIPGITMILHWIENAAGHISAGGSSKIRGRIDLVVRARRIRKHRAFVRRFLPRRAGPLASSQAMKETVRHLEIDTVVVGSDQVWRMDYVPDEQAKADFFLGFAPSPQVRKISYAASFGHGEWMYPTLTAQTTELLAQFDAVSVRETSGVMICAEALSRDDAVHVIDPTLLVDPAFYDCIATATKSKRTKALLTYVMDRDQSSTDIVTRTQSILGSHYTISPMQLDEGFTHLGVEQWVQGFMDADFVITDSFHGTVFAIIFRKNFIAIVNHGRGADRFTSLLGPLGLEDRLVSDPTPEKLGDLVRQSIDFAAVSAKLAPLRVASLAFLRTALDADRRQSA